MKLTSLKQHLDCWELKDAGSRLVVQISDFLRLDVLLAHNVYLFMSNKSAQPSALVNFFFFAQALSCKLPAQ